MGISSELGYGYPCQVCWEYYRSLNALEKHMKADHVEEDNYNEESFP